jgi:hypothetical protein
VHPGRGGQVGIVVAQLGRDVLLVPVHVDVGGDGGRRHLQQIAVLNVARCPRAQRRSAARVCFGRELLQRLPVVGLRALEAGFGGELPVCELVRHDARVFVAVAVVAHLCRVVQRDDRLR